jgi:hypothetical protein
MCLINITFTSQFTKINRTSLRWRRGCRQREKAGLAGSWAEVEGSKAEDCQLPFPNLQL